LIITLYYFTETVKMCTCSRKGHLHLWTSKQKGGPSWEAKMSDCSNYDEGKC